MSNEYCGCCGAKTGSLTVGIISFIISISITIVAVDALVFDGDGLHEGLEAEYLIIGVVNILTSCGCIVGASREKRQLLLPWLFITAIVTLSLFFSAMYFLIFQFQDWVIFGVVLFVFTGGTFYGWMCVAAFYTELKEKDAARAETRTRSFLSAEAVTRPDAFAFPPPPPPYTIAYENSSTVCYDKPPTYEEAAIKQQARIGRV